MQIEIKKLPDSEIEITGEISAGNFEKCRETALKELSRGIKINGFRPGNVPEKILIEKIGEQNILERMAEIAIKKYYPEIIKEQQIKTIGRPEVVVTKIARNNPLGFKIKTAVLPEIKLPDYKNIAANIIKKEEQVVVEEKEIEQVLEYLRKARAPKNERDEEVLPEINNEFAQKVGRFKDLEELKNALKSNLGEEKKMRIREKKRSEILENIAEASKIEVPKIIIESEKEKMIREMKESIGSTGLKWEDYLKHIKKTEEELQQDWQDDASKRAKFGLILNEIAEKEKIEVSENELNTEFKKLLETYKNTFNHIDKERAVSYIYGILRNEKVFKFLESC